MSDPRYFHSDETLALDPISKERPKKLRYFAGGQWKDSKTTKYMPCYNPSTGAVIAQTPACTADEVLEEIPGSDI